MRQKLPKIFSFEEANRSRLTFSDAAKIRMDPKTEQIELKVQSYNLLTGAPVYPLDTDLTVTTWITNPLALVAWDGFMAMPHVQPAGTSVRFKLNDGTNDRFWGGASWDVAGATDWNTEAEVAANIGSFPATSREIAVVCNLVTTDAGVTPYLKAVMLLMDCEIDYLRSLIVDGLMAELRTGLTPRIDMPLRADGGTKLSLADLDTPFNISDVPEVYDHTNDPNHQTNLISSYDSDSKIATLSSAIDRGNVAWARLDLGLEIYLNFADQDYIEIAKLPAAVLESFALSGNTVWAYFQVDDISQYQATVRRTPFRLRLDFDVVLQAEKNRTLLALHEKALEFVSRHPTITWPAIDEVYDLTSNEEGLLNNRPSLKDGRAASMTLSLHNVYLWLRPAETVPLVQQVVYNLSANNERGGVSWSGVLTGQPHPNE